jgi:uncharacterized protein
MIQRSDPTTEFCLEIRPVGNYCPNKCSFCYQNSHNRESSQVMSLHMPIILLEKLKNLFSKNKIKTLKVVFHGGEPSFDGGLWVSKASKMINSWMSNHYSQAKVIFLCHVSGFVKLNKKLFIENSIHISMSRHGSNKMLKNYGISSKELANLIYNFKNFANTNLLVKQNVVITNISIQYLNEIMKLINEYNITTKLIPQFNINRNEKLNTTESQTTNSEIIKFYKELITYSNNRGLSLSNVEPLNRFANYLFDGKNTSGCRFSKSCPFSSPPIWSLTLNNDGKIYPCNRFAGIMSHCLSNIDSNSLLKEIQENLSTLRNYYGYRKCNMTIQCRNCLVKRGGACPSTGGCPFMAYINGTTTDKMDRCIDPHCEIESNIFSLLYSTVEDKKS